jgi:small subunit ribosomal protein S1
VAAVEEPQTSGVDEQVDRDDMYARFEALLGNHAVSFAAGDKVRHRNWICPSSRLYAISTLRRWRRKRTFLPFSALSVPTLQFITSSFCSSRAPYFVIFYDHLASRAIYDVTTPTVQVQGTVFRVDQKGAYVDVGGKSTAVCPTAELSMAKISRATEVVAPDSVREFVVIRGERSGELVLSLKKIETDLAWARLRQYMEEDVSVKAQVVGVNRGGLLIDVENVRGFCPGSQLARRVQTFDELLGKEMEFKVTEVDEEKFRLMLSNKRAAAGEATAGFNVGDVVEGSVISVKPYGAFIDLGGGAAGLLHISQISHDRILNVDKVLSEGDRIKVMVLSQDRERGRVALCTKKLEPTPGDMLRDPALVYAKAEEMAALFKERVAAAEAAAAAAVDGAAAAAAPAAETWETSQVEMDDYQSWGTCFPSLWIFVIAA